AGEWAWTMVTRRVDSQHVRDEVPVLDALSGQRTARPYTVDRIDLLHVVAVALSPASMQSVCEREWLATAPTIGLGELALEEDDSRAAPRNGVDLSRAGLPEEIAGHRMFQVDRPGSAQGKREVIRPRREDGV